jgi:hypothetical protein
MQRVVWHCGIVRPFTVHLHWSLLRTPATGMMQSFGSVVKPSLLRCMGQLALPGSDSNWWMGCLSKCDVASKHLHHSYPCLVHIDNMKCIYTAQHACTHACMHDIRTYCCGARATLRLLCGLSSVLFAAMSSLCRRPGGWMLLVRWQSCCMCASARHVCMHALLLQRHAHAQSIIKQDVQG